MAKTLCLSAPRSFCKPADHKAGLTALQFCPPHIYKFSSPAGSTLTPPLPFFFLSPWSTAPFNAAFLCYKRRDWRQSLRATLLGGLRSKNMAYEKFGVISSTSTRNGALSWQHVDPGGLPARAWRDLRLQLASEKQGSGGSQTSPPGGDPGALPSFPYGRAVAKIVL